MGYWNLWWQRSRLCWQPGRRVIAAHASVRKVVAPAVAATTGTAVAAVAVVTAKTRRKTRAQKHPCSRGCCAQPHSGHRCQLQSCPHPSPRPCHRLHCTLPSTRHQQHQPRSRCCCRGCRCDGARHQHQSNKTHNATRVRAQQSCPTDCLNTPRETPPRTAHTVSSLPGPGPGPGLVAVPPYRRHDDHRTRRTGCWRE